MKIIIGIIGLVFVGYLIFGGPDTTPDATKEMENEVSVVPAEVNTATEEAEIVALDQKVNDVLLVQSVTLPGDGYLVAHRNKEGAPGDVIGNSVLLPAGDSLNVGIPLNQGITLATGEQVFIMIHRDDGDEEYAFPGPDGPVILDDERIPVQLITILAETPAGEVLEMDASDEMKAEMEQ